MCKPLHPLLLYQSMGGGVRFIGRNSSVHTYHKLFPQYLVDMTVIFYNVVTRRGVMSLKTLRDANLFGDIWKGCIMIPFLLFQKGHTFNLNALQPLVPYHIFRIQWSNSFGVVLNCNTRYFETHYETSRKLKSLL